MDWGSCYRSGNTPWDKGEPHPELPFLLEKFSEIIAGTSRILVPGCGLGHDVSLIAGVAGGKIEGLDVAEEAVENAKARYSSDLIQWNCGDLFNWSKGREASYDLVFEHTCFSAISPGRRSDYADAMTSLIGSGGYLLGIFFPKPDHPKDQGPPFHIAIDELCGLFNPAFVLEWSAEPSKTFESREGGGRELSMLWRRK